MVVQLKLKKITKIIKNDTQVLEGACQDQNKYKTL